MNTTTEKHTPGPWEVWTSNSYRRIGSASGPVCEPITQRDGHPDLYFRNGGFEGPDARLIAAAPVLLEALRALSLALHANGWGYDAKLLALADAALEKARG